MKLDKKMGDIANIKKGKSSLTPFFQ